MPTHQRQNLVFIFNWISSRYLISNMVHPVFAYLVVIIT